MNLNYTFKNNDLLQLALTHRSVSKDNNERLEFLGDSVLNIVISEWLYQQANLSEGKLSRLRANLVNQDSLFNIGQKLSLSEEIKLSTGEKATLGSTKPSIISDTVEAIIGAVFLDGGFDAAKQFTLCLFEDTLNAPIESLMIKDAKSLLQEHCQKQGWPLPNYDVSNIEGQAHNQTFHVTLIIHEHKTTGAGRSRKLAEQTAAQEMMTQLGLTYD
ncbi:MAG: ribonuclease III [Gammaproteobacteria bacterium]|nr:ribonuclease III [Gammaproteobacteria bacterium]